ncbi:MAG: DUF3179 domain-containing protein [Chloroflexota bacterium]
MILAGRASPASYLAAIALAFVASGHIGLAPTATTSPTPISTPAPAGTAATSTPLALLDGAREGLVTGFSRSGWKTDFSRRFVPLGELRSGGPPRDGIPPIDRPTLSTVAEAGTWLNAREPVIALAVGGEWRAYPIQVLIWHEIVNGQIGDVPVAVTFCPLCNTAIAFDRRLGGRTLDFGTTGNLRHSDLLMWDRQTESWWQQVTGEAIVGELTGSRLVMLPASIVSWEELKTSAPWARVLSRDTGYARAYGSNPYVGYDRADQSPFVFDGTPDGRLPPMERVVTVSLGGEDVAYPFTSLVRQPVIRDVVGGSPFKSYGVPAPRQLWTVTRSPPRATLVPPWCSARSSRVVRSRLSGTGQSCENVRRAVSGISWALPALGHWLAGSPSQWSAVITSGLRGACSVPPRASDATDRVPRLCASGEQALQRESLC